MAYAPQRSMNGELAEGMTEGTYKRHNPNRGGFVEHTTAEVRRDLSPINYSINETPYKVPPDGTIRHARGTIYYETQILPPEAK